MWRFAALVVAACAGRTVGTADVHNTAAKQDSGLLNRRRISLASLDSVGLSTTRDSVIPEPLCPLAIGHMLGDAIVFDCGQFDNEKLPFDATGDAHLLAARACAAEALTSREPFTLMWRSFGADPSCDDQRIGAPCGFQDHEVIWVLVGVVGRAGYATYWIESRVDRYGPPAPPGGTAPVQSTSSTKTVRCRMVDVNPPERCLDDHNFPNCFTCEGEVEVASCERGS